MASCLLMIYWHKLKLKKKTAKAFFLSLVYYKTKDHTRARILPPNGCGFLFVIQEIQKGHYDIALAPHGLMLVAEATPF